MSSNSADELGELFVAITGESTVEDHQECSYPVRLASRPGESDVSDAVSEAVRATGLEDALDVPDGS